MSDDFAYLPQQLAEIAEVAGLDAALKLAEARGGQAVYIPARAPEGHWLVQCVGRTAADAICRHYACYMPSDAEPSHHGLKIVIPLGVTSVVAKARRRAVDMLLSGASNPAAARASGLHLRTIEKLRQRLRLRDNRQGNLF
ncbi:hypothetical protein LG047_12675 [Methylocystis sp. WRRC1]|uniref:hypothetical protein n=1 Tax=unclassified Methylocystis TaxID=2625913 RepID=UPI0001F86852|nr:MULTISPECIES: hypothetical protein [unclassified Methylocystis]MCC3246164.1 hypothetical protein [Methylocystis sp. WRRC1]